MRKLFLTVVAASLILTACGNQNQAGKEKAGESTSTVQGATEGSVKITKDVFLKKVWDYSSSPNDFKYLGDKPAIIDFYADWCPPCKIASPILDEIGTEYAGKINVYKVNTDQERELAQVFGISGIPSFLYIPLNGKPVMMSGIARSKEDTKKMFVDNIEKILSVKK